MQSWERLTLDSAASLQMASLALEVDALTIESVPANYRRSRHGESSRRVNLVDRVSFSIRRGATLALVGESGSGKSLTASALLGLLPPGTQRTQGAIRLDGRAVTTITDAAWCAVRGRIASIIFQEPMTALHPLIRVGEQIAECLRLHMGLRRAAARERSIELLRRVGIAEPALRVDSYPHELSGGMRQRVAIAMAISCAPVLLIADEPTTALDVTVQAQIMDLLRELQRECGMAILFISHDLALVADFADEVAVMYAGRIVEHASTTRLFSQPQHPYTKALLRCVPGPHSAVAASVGGALRLPTIPGDVPRPHSRPGGCAFHPRCSESRDDPRCSAETPELLQFVEDQRCACWKVRTSD